MISALVHPRLALLSIILLAGCASGPSLFVNSDPSASFATYKTYDFAKPLDTDRDGYSSVLSQYLRTAASRELEARGYQRSDNPDLLVNFHVATKEKVQTTTTQSAVPMRGYYGYRSGYYGVWSGYDTEVTQYTEGTLTMDIVDPARKQLVWEGTAVGRVRDKDRANLQPVVDKVISQLFSKYSYRAP
ncbi:MAG: DUF4136 domain-containing protein [Gammaproteobacteria bacterium]